MSGINKELLEALEECLPCIGWVGFSDEELVREHELGNGYAEIILRARRAIAKARGHITIPVTQSAIDAASQEEEEK